MSSVPNPLIFLKTNVNSALSSFEPWQIVTLTTTTVLVTVWLYEFLNENESVIVRGKKTVFRLARYIPAVRRKVEAELQGMSEGFQKTVAERSKNSTYIVNLPKNGLSKNDILKHVEENVELSDFDYKLGHVSGTVYVDNEELRNLVTEVYRKTLYTNPLHPDTFPGLCKMEAEVVRMAANLFNGDEHVCGTMTSGGTESILMACKAFRDYALEVKGIKKPEIVIPVTAHAAFDKASQYLRLRVRYVPVDPHTMEVDITAMKRLINSNTVLLAGSVPNFPYGTMDNIVEIANLGHKYKIPVHVDACLGGFLAVFMEDAGYPFPLFDFNLPGVTSISADTHKYGYSPKGSSVILYRDQKYLHYQYTVTTDWPGGVYGSPTVSGSRAGGNIAVCWASLLHFGREGYVQATRDIIHTTRYIEKGLKRMKGIFIFGQPATSVVAIGSHDFDIFRLSGELNRLGWNLNILQFPSGIHLCVTHIHTKPGVADEFLKDVRNCLTDLLADPGAPVEGKMALYGVAQQLPDRSIVGDITRLFLDSMYYTRSES